MRAQEFTEPGAAGIVLYAEDTGRWGLQQRSDSVNDPGLWAAWGGGREPGESLEQCARRELAEESGYRGPVRLEPLAKNAKYMTFIGVVPHEFEPRSSDEWKDYCWTELGKWPSPMHPGTAAALENVYIKENFADGKVKGMQKADQDHLIRQIQTARKLGDSQFDEALVHRGLITKQDPNDIWHVRDDATRKLRHHKGAVILAQAQPKIYSAGQAMKSYQLEPRYDGKMIRSLPSFHYAYIQGKMLPKLPSDIDQGRQLWFQSGKGFVYADTKQPFQGADYVYFGPDKKVIAYNSARPVAISGPEVSVKPAEEVAENFADGKVKGKSRPGRVKRAGASCDGSVTDLRQRAKNASGERARMYHWCANMKSGKKK